MSSALSVTGKLIFKGATQQVSDKFSKREFVLELAEEINGNVYTNYCKMQLVQTKCSLLDAFVEGAMIEATFNIKGNRWEKDGKVNYITNLDVWRIQPSVAVAPQASAPTQQMNMAGPAATPQPAQGGMNFNSVPGATDDLPF